MSDTVAEDPDPYSWAADRVEEERRLIAQSRLLEPMTEELLRRAGLAPGMHVLDLGSGAGDCAILAACRQALAPGSLVWFLEPDVTYDFAMPASPLWERVQHWLERAIVGIGAEPRMGPRLHRAFRHAGLPSPDMHTSTIMAGPSAAPVWFYVNALRGILPVLEELGLGRAADVDVDTLEARLAADLAAHDAAMILPPFTAAWARLPA